MKEETLIFKVRFIFFNEGFLIKNETKENKLCTLLKISSFLGIIQIP